ncbi:MAG: L-2-amino-thiazoline-4-carboxylic acid hydrolase [Candidatus Diapherotrites archaeon]|nr:L-2-amino-thiazoline-4-carboxylic acid hydrolase [Candidatus Diapherotrites archaeon]
MPDYKKLFEEAVATIGSLYRDFLNLIEDKRSYKGVKELTELMRKKGLKTGKKLKEKLKGKELEIAAKLLLDLHGRLGFKSKVVKKEKNKIVIRVSYCPWNAKVKGWNSKLCASLDAYEQGLVMAVNAKIKHGVSKRLSLGDKCCEIVLWR